MNSSANETINGEGGITLKDDGLLAATILIVTAVVVIAGAIYLWRNKRLLGIGDGDWRTGAFTPPPDRAKYLEAKEKLDPAVPAELEELKKLLMRRAIQAIPILLNLQNEGNSIERLYKRGMLTDDMHFKVKGLKTFVDQEFQDVQVEADDLVEGWGTHIWPQAMQFHQMIQKQAEDKNNEIAQAEEQKKKAAIEKKKEKEKAKKQSKDTGVVEAASSPSNVLTAETLDPETAKAIEAERMAQQLLEEEERERNSKKSSATKGAKK